ncbi:aspartyl-phosphate phosphatase Spo0E family protein [Bacillus sp. ISL-47]|uniref:aspartyl-phosphate phosphatase Spo0E family protein n=1 Tax=Bacillus sp. ISL-47 TaxID=2819130 RepID=UPI001BE74121|nr:aspartyl-phosphate phosphatase Spo0E family protein [Bacillus sp. ISL-47]MBT2688368.1 aspartyl-phosphate phosphatase Spo0E family protein [Bacillus sp. ISL-47]MBT2710521.1 aspartyl-phosphate phosphatase Spo0E family protein [Pseudomonas sp. ISL-84]
MNITATSGNILDEILKLRKKMITSGIQNGLTHPETIKYSRELDELIYKFLSEK